MAWTASSGQVYVINGDSLYCYTTADIRKIATKLVELDGCEEQLAISFSELELKDRQLATFREIEQGLNSQLSFQQASINLHIQDKDALKESVQIYKRKNLATMIVSGIVCGGVIFLSVR